MEMIPVTRVRNVPNINWNTENIKARNGGVFWQLVLNTAAASAKAVNYIAANTGTGTVTEEQKLKNKYPGLVYNVYDSGTPYWGVGSDYDQEIIFQKGLQGDGKVKPGSRAVTIHENAASRMGSDREFAMMVSKRIDTWFAFEKARSEAASPGSSSGLSMGVVIGRDGSIVSTVTVPAGDAAAEASNSFYDMLWQARLVADNAVLNQQYAAMDDAKSAAAQLAMMLNSGELQSVLGITVAGVPTEQIVKETKKKVLGIEES